MLSASGALEGQFALHCPNPLLALNSGLPWPPPPSDTEESLPADWTLRIAFSAVGARRVLGKLVLMSCPLQLCPAKEVAL